MRKAFAFLILLLTGALCVCGFFARRSSKENAKVVLHMILSLIPPMIGNMLIIVTDDHLAADVGSYLYFLGMDLVMLSVVRFSFGYCGVAKPGKAIRYLVYTLLTADVIQLCLNPFFGHAFEHGMIEYEGYPYFQLIPHLGQTFHRIVDYGILAVAMGVFIHKTANCNRLYTERYAVILTVMAGTTLWESFYIFTRTPIDRSMIGFGVFGLLVFYFTLYYRPVRLLNQMMANIVGELHQALYFFDQDGKCIWVNEPGMRLIGISDPEYKDAREKIKETFGEIPQAGKWSGRGTTGTGEAIRYYALERIPLEDRKNRMAGSLLTIRDITGEEQEHARERYLASHDTLTGLYNRDYLYEQIGQRIRKNPDKNWLVVFVNIKNFKIVNDIFGNEFGDHVLREVGKWVASDMSENTIYGRLVGDTFGAAVPADEFIEERIERKLSDFPVRFGEMEHSVFIHVGVYEVTEPELDVSVMFDRARLALSTIQDNYQKHIAYYDEQMRSRVLTSQQLSGQLTEAIAKRQIMPFLQPLTDSQGRVVGAEALVRWIHPERGFLPPADFIPTFEENGMIAQLDRAMWRFACEILSEWKVTHPELFISVNISPKDFYFMDVASEIRNLVREYRLEPSALRLEITETVMMNDMDKHLQMIRDMRKTGFLVEMDDFGSGYSSFNMLKDMPVDVLKIDMKFLSRSEEKMKTRRILNGIVSMAEDLGLESIIEGVETEQQYKMLATMGCRLFQGYYIAKPMNRSEFELFLEKSETQKDLPGIA